MTDKTTDSKSTSTSSSLSSSFKGDKDEARDARMHPLRKTEEERLRKVLKEEAQKKCIDFYHALGKCATAEGAMVVFRCRTESKELNDCLSRHYNDELFRDYLVSKGLPPPKPPKYLWNEIKNLIFG